MAGKTGAVKNRANVYAAATSAVISIFINVLIEKHPEWRPFLDMLIGGLL